MRQVAVAGVGLIPFKNYDGQKGRPFKQFWEMGAEAIINVLDSSGFEFKDIQAAFGGSTFCGSAVTHQCLKQLGQSGIPIVNVDAPAAASMQAFRQAYLAVAHGEVDVALALGVEKVPHGLIPNPTVPEYKKRMGIDVVPAISAQGAVKIMHEHGVTVEDFARVVVQERKYGNLNPNAFWYGRGEVTIEQVVSSPVFVTPTTLFMMGPSTEGASAAIVCSKNKLKSRSKAVTVAAASQVSDMYSTNEPVSVNIQNPPMFKLAFDQACKQSGMGPEDISLVEAHDSSAPSIIEEIEELGFVKPGEFSHLFKEGYFAIGGKLPVNTDGGFIGRGHPFSASGLAQIYNLFYQLKGERGQLQVEGAKVGLAFNAGAGESGFAVILKR